MSDTPRNDNAEDRGDDVYRDPTAPSDAPSYGPPSSAGSPEVTEQLPIGGDTQQVPTESATPPPPGAAPAPQSPYAAPSGDVPQNPYATPPAGAAPQAPYTAAPEGQSYPSQGDVAAQHGVPGTPAPPGYGQASAYGQAPGYGQNPYGAPPGHAPSASLSGGSIALLVVSGLLTLVGCGVGIPALVFAIIAATKKDQPSEVAKWTKWGWIALGVTIAALVIVGVIVIVGLFAVGGSGSGSGSGY